MNSSQEILEIAFSSLNGLIIICIGVYLYIYGYAFVPELKRKKSTIWYVFISIVAGVWSMLASSLYLPNPAIYDPILSYVISGFLPFCFLGFVRYLISGNSVVWDIRWKAFFFFGLSVLGYIAIPEIGLVSYQSGEAIVRLNEFPHYLHSFYLVIGFSLVFILLVRAIIQTPSRRKEFQSVLLATGIAVGWGMLFGVFIPLITNQNIFFRISPLGLLWMNIIIAWVIKKHRLFTVTSMSLKVFLLIMIVTVSFYLEIIKYRFDIDSNSGSARILMLGSIVVLTYMIYRQILEGIRYTAQLKEVQLNLESLVEEKNLFLQISSHQLRTPVSVLSGYIEKIRDDLPTYHAGQRVKDIFDRLLIQVSSLSDIVIDVLSVNSLRSGNFELAEKQPIEMNACFTTILTQKEFLIETLKMNVEFHPSPDPIFVMADQVKITQAMINVFENALRYGQSVVEVSIIRSDDVVNIVVSDDGFGISQEQQKWVFEKFTRSEAAQNKRPDGSGVGLYLSRLIVQKHHGDITVYSQGVGMGSTFTITLPISS